MAKVCFYSNKMRQVELEQIVSITKKNLMTKSWSCEQQIYMSMFNG